MPWKYNPGMLSILPWVAGNVNLIIRPRILIGKLIPQHALSENVTADLFLLSANSRPVSVIC